jgi:hypothetical protein
MPAGHHVTVGRTDIADPLRLARESEQVVIGLVADLQEGIAAYYPERRPGTSSTTTSFGPTPRVTRNGPSRFCTR